MDLLGYSVRGGIDHRQDRSVLLFCIPNKAGRSIVGESTGLLGCSTGLLGNGKEAAMKHNADGLIALLQVIIVFLLIFKS